jgi:hypothetical protein
MLVRLLPTIFYCLIIDNHRMKWVIRKIASQSEDLTLMFPFVKKDMHISVLYFSTNGA